MINDTNIDSIIGLVENTVQNSVTVVSNIQRNIVVGSEIKCKSTTIIYHYKY